VAQSGLWWLSQGFGGSVKVVVAQSRGFGGSVDMGLVSKSRLPTQRSRDRIRQPAQSPERAQENRLCKCVSKTNLGLGGPSGVKKNSDIQYQPFTLTVSVTLYNFDKRFYKCKTYTQRIDKV
jgi:hypothetical protein